MAQHQLGLVSAAMQILMARLAKQVFLTRAAWEERRLWGAPRIAAQRVFTEYFLAVVLPVQGLVQLAPCPTMEPRELAGLWSCGGERGLKQRR
jgi:hypothetical protein